MKIKKYLCFVGMLSLMMNAGSVYAEGNQDDFLKDMSEGLAARWAYDENEDTMIREEFIEYRKKLVNEEYTRLSKYQDETFGNKKFDLMAQAYIDALESQLKALDYYEDLEKFYDVLWSSGYDVRALVIPTFVDSYGLVADDVYVNEFRVGSDSYTTTTTVSIPSDVASQTTTEFEIYNNEGITIYVTGVENTTYDSKRITMRIENLNHHDIIVNTKNADIVVNGKMLISSLYADVKSGKTSNSYLELYNNELESAGIDSVKDISFELAIVDANNWSTLYYSDQIDLSIDEEDNVTSRLVYGDKETIRKVQELLTAAGYDCGSTDGVAGKKTHSAILQFERDHGLEDDTAITPELLEKLESAI